LTCLEVGPYDCSFLSDWNAVEKYVILMNDWNSEKNCFNNTMGDGRHDLHWFNNL